MRSALALAALSLLATAVPVDEAVAGASTFVGTSYGVEGPTLVALLAVAGLLVAALAVLLLFRRKRS